MFQFIFLQLLIIVSIVMSAWLLRSGLIDAGVNPTAARRLGASCGLALAVIYGTGLMLMTKM